MTAPYYADAHVTLWHADCLEHLDWLDADVLVTDPPYGRGWRQGNLKGRSNSDAHPGIAGDRDTGCRDAALDTWDSARVALVFGDLMLPPPRGTKQVLIYRKPNDSGARGATGGRRRDAEAIYMIGPWPTGLSGRTSVLATAARMVGSRYGLAARYGHPHAKPGDVMAELIDMCPAGVVADPFAGSGSTLVAAKLAGRRGVGVEIDERYCEIAARRLAQEPLPFEVIS